MYTFEDVKRITGKQEHKDIAEIFNVTPQAVSNWITKGIPKKVQLILMEMEKGSYSKQKEDPVEMTMLLTSRGLSDEEKVRVITYIQKLKDERGKPESEGKPNPARLAANGTG